MTDYRLDYGTSPQDRKRQMRRFLLVSGSVLLCFVLVIAYVWLASFSTLSSCFMRSFDGRLKRDAGLGLPASYVELERTSYGLIEETSFYKGTLAPADADAFIKLLEGRAVTRVTDTNAKNVVHFGIPPPAWWTATTWSDRRTFDVERPAGVILIHISPSTGAIEIEWGTF